MAKHKKKNGGKKKCEEKTDNTIALKLLVSALFAGLNFSAIYFLNRLIYSDCLFFAPKAAIIMAGINSTVILFSAFFVSKNTIKYIKTHKLNSVIIATITCLFLILPVFMFKSGTIADNQSIRKYNMFGKVVKEYSYSDVTHFNMNTHRGIEYDIEFESGDTVLLRARELLPFYNFGNDSNLKQFDEILEKYGERTVNDPVWSMPDNTRRFFRDEQVFEYFDNIFSQYYEKIGPFTN